MVTGVVVVYLTETPIVLLVREGLAESGSGEGNHVCGRDRKDPGAARAERWQDVKCGTVQTPTERNGSPTVASRALEMS